MDAFEKMLDAFDAHAATLRLYRMTKRTIESHTENPSVKLDSVSLEERERSLEAAKAELKQAFDSYVREMLSGE
jgi:hypothetical protein